MSHPDWSENCQGRIIGDAGDSVNVSDLDDWCRYAGLDIRTWYRLTLRPTSERLAANWSLGLQHAPTLGLHSRQRKRDFVPKRESARSRLPSRQSYRDRAPFLGSGDVAPGDGTLGQCLSP